MVERIQITNVDTTAAPIYVKVASSVDSNYLLAVTLSPSETVILDNAVVALANGEWIAAWIHGGTLYTVDYVVTAKEYPRSMGFDNAQD